MQAPYLDQQLKEVSLTGRLSPPLSHTTQAGWWSKKCQSIVHETFRCYSFFFFMTYILRGLNKPHKKTDRQVNLLNLFSMKTLDKTLA